MRYLSFFLLLLSVSILQAQTFRWVDSNGGYNWNEFGIDVDTDADGAVYTTGRYGDSSEFGGTLQFLSGMTDLFLHKHSDAGNFNWFFRAGGSGPDRGVRVYAGHPGYVYVTGYAKTGISPPTFSSADVMHSRDVFSARWDTAGNLLWVQTVDGNNYGEGYGITADPTGVSYVTGGFNTVAYFLPGDTLVSNGATDVFLVSYGPFGTPYWVKKFGGTLDDYGRDISRDGDGNLYICGYYTGTMIVGTDVLTAKSGKESFLIKTGPYGDPLWAMSLGGSSNEELVSMEVTEDGHIYLFGFFSDSLFISGDTLLSSGDTDSFISRLDSAGNVEWTQVIGGAAGQFPQDLDIDSRENVFVCGYFYSGLTADTASLTAYGAEDYYFAVYDSTGNLKLVKNYATAGTEFAFGIAADEAENIYLTGSYFGSTTFDSLSVNGVAFSEDIYTAKWCNTPGIIIEDVSGPPVCINDVFSVTFHATGCFEAANIWSVELSDASGSFAAPVVIGSGSGKYGQSVSCTVPSGITGGSGYRVRITSTAPALTSAVNGFDIALSAISSTPVNITGDTVVCPGDSILLTADPGFAHYTWSTGDTTVSIHITSPGVYWVDVTDAPGCTTRAEHEVAMCVGRTDPSASLFAAELFPNPGSSGFFIRFAQPRNASGFVLLYDLTGRELMRVPAEVHSGNSVCEISTVQLPEGLYIVSCVLNGSSRSWLWQKE